MTRTRTRMQTAATLERPQVCIKYPNSYPSTYPELKHIQEYPNFYPSTYDNLSLIETYPTISSYFFAIRDKP